jgi:hypothetical protein
MVEAVDTPGNNADDGEGLAIVHTGAPPNKGAAKQSDARATIAQAVQAIEAGLAAATTGNPISADSLRSMVRLPGPQWVEALRRVVAEKIAAIEVDGRGNARYRYVPPHARR